jgi:hypothetical protein
MFLQHWRILARTLILLQSAALGIALAAQPQCCQAQQNLFNVPSGEITTPGNIFFQQQFNFTNISTSNSTLDFGLPDDWEIGLNFLDYRFSGPSQVLPPELRSQQQANPDALFNFAHSEHLSEHVKLAVGSQIGFSPKRTKHPAQFLNFTYMITQFEWPTGEETDRDTQEDYGVDNDNDDDVPVPRFWFGGYYANHAYGGPGASAAFMLGTEIPLIPAKFHFMADYYTGRNDLAVGVIGFVYFTDFRWQVSLGGQLPAPHSGNNYGAVLELTYL